MHAFEEGELYLLIHEAKMLEEENATYITFLC